MEIRTLKYFLEICRTGSINRVAKEHYMSQQGLSRMIASLENDLEGPLFIRSRTGVTLTHRGEILYKYAQRILSEYEKMQGEMGLLTEQKHAQLSVVYAYGVLSQLSLHIPNSFRIEYPKIDLLIAEYPYSSAERLIQERRFDLGFAYLPIDRELFDFTSIYKAPWPLIVHKDNPLACRERVTCQDIVSQKLVLISESFKGHFTFLNRCHELGLKPNVIATINDLSESYKWAQDNEAIVFSTFNACEKLNDPNLRVILLEDEVCTAEIGLISRAGEPLSPTASLFFKYVTSNLPSAP